jgi:hypothetical protein
MNGDVMGGMLGRPWRDMVQASGSRTRVVQNAHPVDAACRGP